MVYKPVEDNLHFAQDRYAVKVSDTTMMSKELMSGQKNSK
jgi:hypothetical protein